MSPIRSPHRPYEPWYGAVPTLTAAAGVTATLRIETPVTSVEPRSPIVA
jgi:hypothetical protein